MGQVTVNARQDKGLDILEPDVMTPVQFFGALRRRSWHDGERRLMAAVLQDGIETFQKYALASDPAGREMFDEVRAWVGARFDRSLFSFVTVCEILELDPDYLRAGLFRWRDRKRLELAANARRKLDRYATARS